MEKETRQQNGSEDPLWKNLVHSLKPTPAAQNLKEHIAPDLAGLETNPFAPFPSRARPFLRALFVRRFRYVGKSNTAAGGCHER